MEAVTAEERRLCARIAGGAGPLTPGLASAARRHRVHLLLATRLSEEERQTHEGVSLARELTVAEAAGAASARVCRSDRAGARRNGSSAPEDDDRVDEYHGMETGGAYFLLDLRSCKPVFIGKQPGALDASDDVAFLERPVASPQPSCKTRKRGSTAAWRIFCGGWEAIAGLKRRTAELIHVRSRRGRSRTIAGPIPANPSPRRCGRRRIREALSRAHERASALRQ
jgi:hypothetical protein